MAMRRLAIGIGELAMAMEDHGEMGEWFLDTQTGEFLRIPEDLIEEEDEEALALIEGDPERYEPVPEIPSYEMYDLMARFAGSVDDPRLQDLLTVALDGRGAFGRFKRVLLDYPEERERWFRMRDAHVEERMLDWLSSLGIEPVETSG